MVKTTFVMEIHLMCEKLFDRCDQDGDGKLSREEFANMMMRDHK
jgi:Ca2+-binding EF-hand superfamily protein